MTTTSDNSQENQKIKSGRGGKRPGAGRKPMHGAEEVTRKMKRKFNDYVTEEQIEGIVAVAIADALEGRTDMQKFLMDQWFGKSTQRTELTGAEGEGLKIMFDEALKK